MKRVTTFLMALVMLLGLVGVPSNASSSSQPKIWLDRDVTLAPGESGKIDVHLEGNPGIYSLGFYIYYTDTLTISSASVNDTKDGGSTIWAQFKDEQTNKDGGYTFQDQKRVAKSDSRAVFGYVCNPPEEEDYPEVPLSSDGVIGSINVTAGDSEGDVTLVVEFTSAMGENNSKVAIETENCVVHIKNAEKKHTVTFEVNGGSAVEAQEVEAGKTATEPAKPTNGDKIFDNWYTDAEYKNVYNFSTPVTADITLYAKWNDPPTTYKVTFDSQGGSAVEAQEVEAGKTATKPANPTNGDKIFDNWYTDAECTNVYDFSAPVTVPITLYANWIEPNVKHKVTFDSKGGSAVEAQEVEDGKTATEPAKPTNGDKIFDNWYTDAEYKNVYNFSTPVTADITLYAKWNDPIPTIKYKVTFESNGGSAVEAQEVEAGKTATEPAKPTNGDKIFDNWYTDAEYKNVYNFSTPVTADITLYAKWNDPPTTYKVTFDSQGGSAVEAQEVEAGKTATKPANPTNGDKIFDNWYTDAEYKNVYNFSTPVTADITLYAKWNDPPTTYKVTFDSQGGSAVEAQEVEAGKTATKPANPTNGDKIFDNWYTDAECTNVYDFSAPVTVPITLYANWIEPTPYNITTKDPNGGTLSVDKTTATKGTRITVTVTLNKIEADTSYEVNVTFGGQKVKATQDKENAKKFVASFDMPASDVEVSATIEASACYIATAVYGSYDCPEVWTLRRFRDDVLGQSWYGRLFIKAYYAVSPTVLRIFGNADWFQNFWRDRLDNLVGNLQAQGFASTPYQDLEW